MSRKCCCLLGVPRMLLMDCPYPPQNRCQSSREPPSTPPSLTSAPWEGSAQGSPASLALNWVENKHADLVFGDFGSMNSACSQSVFSSGSNRKRWHGPARVSQEQELFLSKRSSNHCEPRRGRGEISGPKGTKTGFWKALSTYKGAPLYPQAIRRL